MNAMKKLNFAGAGVSLTGSLQWGRVLMNAETSRVFWFARSSGHLLQWGRVLMNAKTKKDAEVQPRECASMGPRSHERGNKGAAADREPTRTLQWGRVLMNAETRPLRSPVGSPRPRFNGAAFS